MAFNMQKTLRLFSVFSRSESGNVDLNRVKNYLSVHRRLMCQNVKSDETTTKSEEVTNNSEMKPNLQSGEISEENVLKVSNIAADSPSADTKTVDKASKSSFLQSFENYTSDEFLNPVVPSKPDESFATMFRNSKFVHLGDPKGKVVVGKIFQVVGDDLYVDFGWKFHCVVQRPTTNSGLYVRNATVRLRINELELSTQFLGSSSETSLNEADCMLLGLQTTPLRKTRTKQL